MAEVLEIDLREIVPPHLGKTPSVAEEEMEDIVKILRAYLK